MINSLRKIDKTLKTFFDNLGIPNLTQMDNVVEKLEDKVWNGVSTFKIKDDSSYFISYLLLVAFSIVTIGSTASLYSLNVPEVAKDGLRLVTLISVVGLIGIVLHLAVNKMTGEK